MSMFEHEAKQFKFDVMREVSMRAFKGALNDNTPDDIAQLLIPKGKANFRCCIYKEREVIRQEVKIACGLDPVDGKSTSDSKQIVRVIEPACDGCTINRIIITNNCRKCMAKTCQSACKFNAITMGEHQAEINYKKCVECGLCAKNCPYNAVVITERPCSQKCPVNAIAYDADGIAVIDENLCINCGNCEKACPFGAIEDINCMVEVINDIKEDVKITAIFAPSIQGQFEDASINQIKKSFVKLGFSDAVEVAVGADAVATYEFEEFTEMYENNKLLTTSCCPAFLNLAKIHYPKVYKENMSTTISPMVALARYLKKKDPTSKVCFIGPCVAKKYEAKCEGSFVDYVISYQEVAAMLVSQKIIPGEFIVDKDAEASIYARNFAVGKGVSNAVAQVAKEKGFDKPIKIVYADGCAECKKNLMLAGIGKLDANLLEGMSCIGGCINGPVVVESSMIAKRRMIKENSDLENVNIEKTLERFDFSDIDMHRKY